jgi:LytS/YehU family sensor histidine kinase
MLSYENRIFFFKARVIMYILLALIAALIELGCRYIIRLQQFRTREKELETLKLKEQLTQAQLDALHAKVNPHFLYNSLNSIAGLALTDGKKTQQMAVSLSKFFRYSINPKEDNLVTVGEELEMVETYLKIEQIRFEERLDFEIFVTPGTEEIKIPRFILQPLVENSVKHGMKGKEGKLFVRLQAQMEGKKLSLFVEDDGQPFGDDLKPGCGLKSIYDKLDILFPEKYEVALYDEPVKQVRILIEI